MGLIPGLLLDTTWIILCLGEMDITALADSAMTTRG
jgi:hypothetical protein